MPERRETASWLFIIRYLLIDQSISLRNLPLTGSGMKRQILDSDARRLCGLQNANVRITKYGLKLNLYRLCDECQFRWTSAATESTAEKYALAASE